MSKGKGKVPNAYEVNPMLMEQMDQITPENFVQFMMGNPEIVGEKFRKTYWKNFKTLGIFTGLCTIGGFASNIAVTRFLPNFLILPKIVKIPLRLAIFALPFAVCYPKLAHHYELGNEMVEDQFLKIQRFRRTGNIEEYFADSKWLFDIRIIRYHWHLLSQLLIIKHGR